MEIKGQHVGMGIGPVCGEGFRCLILVKACPARIS